jgi:hypothetical protein
MKYLLLFALFIGLGVACYDPIMKMVESKRLSAGHPFQILSQPQAQPEAQARSHAQAQAKLAEQNDLPQFDPNKNYYFKGEGEIRDLSIYELEDKAYVRALLSRGQIIEKGGTAVQPVKAAAAADAEQNGEPALSNQKPEALLNKKARERQEALRAVSSELLNQDEAHRSK